MMSAPVARATTTARTSATPALLSTAQCAVANARPGVLVQGKYPQYGGCQGSTSQFQSLTPRDCAGLQAYGQVVKNLFATLHQHTSSFPRQHYRKAISDEQSHHWPGLRSWRSLATRRSLAPPQMSHFLAVTCSFVSVTNLVDLRPGTAHAHSSTTLSPRSGGPALGGAIIEVSISNVLCMLRYEPSTLYGRRPVLYIRRPVV